MTLQLLWKEYQFAHDGRAYKYSEYSAFCEKYAAFARSLKISASSAQGRRAAVRGLLRGQTVELVNIFSGEIKGDSLRSNSASNQTSTTEAAMAEDISRGG